MLSSTPLTALRDNPAMLGWLYFTIGLTLVVLVIAIVLWVIGIRRSRDNVNSSEDE